MVDQCAAGMNWGAADRGCQSGDGDPRGGSRTGPRNWRRCNGQAPKGNSAADIFQNVDSAARHRLRPGRMGSSFFDAEDGLQSRRPCKP